jgi:hypothetical protein
MSDYTPIFSGGCFPYTSQASGTITGGQLVMVSGSGTVAVATQAGEASAVGVAGHDAVSGQKVTVWPLQGVTHEVVAQGGITAGARVRVGTVNGTFATIGAGTVPLGVAMTTAADTALVRVLGGV